MNRRYAIRGLLGTLGAVVMPIGVVVAAPPQSGTIPHLTEADQLRLFRVIFNRLDDLRYLSSDPKWLREAWLRSERLDPAENTAAFVVSGR